MSKNKNQYKIILTASLVIFSFFLSSRIIFAKGGLPNTDSSNTYKLLAPLGPKYKEVQTNDIGEYFNQFFNIAIGLAGALAVIMIVIGGVQWMGSESIFGKAEGKKRVVQAILGLLIAVASYALLNTLNPDLLGKKGLHVDQITNQQSKTNSSSSSNNVKTIK